MNNHLQVHRAHYTSNFASNSENFEHPTPLNSLVKILESSNCQRLPPQWIHSCLTSLRIEIPRKALPLWTHMHQKMKVQTPLLSLHLIFKMSPSTLLQSTKRTQKKICLQSLP